MLAVSPHSVGRWMAGVPDWEEALRQRTLASCGVTAKDYICVLTSGATAALRLAGELVPWAPGAAFAWLQDNHNSVLGIRQLAARAGAATYVMGELDDVRSLRSVGESATAIHTPDGPRGSLGLFAFPMESNFDGRRYGLEAIEAAKQQLGALDGRNWLVLLDAAKGAASGPPNLARYPADLVAMSYYKLFGYPTGLGALLIRRDSLAYLTGKVYYGGGSVTLSLHDRLVHRQREAPAGLEDGTPPFLAFPSALAGFDFVDRVGGWEAVRRHSAGIAARLARRLAAARHANGRPLCRLHGAWREVLGDELRSASDQGSIAKQGPTVCFSVCDAGGRPVGYREVEQLACLHGIVLRTGAMCNPGACSRALGLSGEEMEAHHRAGHVCWDGRDVIDGKATGAVRASFGYGSRLRDADAIADFLERFFLSAPDAERAAGSAGHALSGPASGPLVLSSITLYPIKSCRGLTVSSWPLGPSGLLHDRRFSIADSGGRALTPKICPRVSHVQPLIDWRAGTMSLRCVADGGVLAPDSATVPLDSCAQSLALRDWLAAVLGRQVTLVEVVGKRASSAVGRSRLIEDGASRPPSALASPFGSPGETSSERNASANAVASTETALRNDTRSEAATTAPLPSQFATSGQLLIASTTSLEFLRRRSGLEDEPLTDFAARFRPNLVVEGPATCVPFAEDGWTAVHSQQGGVAMSVAGSCPRCDRICFHHASGRYEALTDMVAAFWFFFFWLWRVLGNVFLHKIVICMEPPSSGPHPYCHLQAGRP